MGQLQDKVCSITGGAGSIGLATADLFLAEGARVMLVDLKDGDLQQAVKNRDPRRIAYATADVTRTDQVKAYIDKTLTAWGRIEVLSSNAGNIGVIRPIADYPEEVFDQVLRRDATDFFNQLIPLGRHARPEEIARSALYLASAQSSFTTGATLMVDGGMSA